MLGAERIRGIVAGLDVRHALTGDDDRPVRDARDEWVCDAVTRYTSRGDAAAVRLACSVLRHRPQLWVAALDVAQRQGGPFVTALEEVLKDGTDLPAITVLAAIRPGIRPCVVLRSRHSLVSWGHPGDWRICSVCPCTCPKRGIVWAPWKRPGKPSGFTVNEA